MRERQRAKSGAELDLGGLERRLGYVVRRAQVWIFQDFVRTLARHEIRPAQYSVLTVIGANPGVSPSAVAEALGIERARLVGMLDELEQRALAERAASTTDRRARHLFLTRKGKLLLKRLDARVDEHERHVVERIGEGARKEVLRLLAPFLDY